MKLATEVEYLSLSKSSDLFPGRPHVSTLRRYVTRGLNGSTLRVVRSAGNLWTTAEWIREFLVETNQEKKPMASLTRMQRLNDATRRLVVDFEIGKETSH